MSDLSIPDATNAWMRREIESGVYEQIEQEWCRELPGGEVALELGAGIGMVTRVLAERYHRVTAVEANAELYPHWNQNALNFGGIVRSIERARRVELRHGMIGGDRLRLCAHEWWKSTGSARPITSDHPVVDVAVPRLSLMQLIEDVRPDAIVCDIEGAEIELTYAAAGRALRNVRDIIVELHPALWEHNTTEDEIERPAWYEDAVEKRFREALHDAGFANVREVKASGWPIGTPHPLGIKHIWWKRLG